MQEASKKPHKGDKGSDPVAHANIYLDSLLWLTPSDPFPQGSDGRTQISYAFGGSGSYEVHDSGSSVDRLTATAWAPAERAAALEALRAWTSVADIDLAPASSFGQATFKLLATTESGMADYFGGEPEILGFATLPNDYSAYPYGPPGSGEDGYTPGFGAFNTEGYGWTPAGLQPGGYGFVTLIHEIGHLFGLDHPFDEGGLIYGPNGAVVGEEPFFPGATGEYKVGAYGLNQGIYTTMTYNDGWGREPSDSEEFGWQKGPMAFDIAAMQALFGKNMAHKLGDQVYRLPDHNVAGTGWSSIWDAGGDDTILVPGAAGAATIDLRDAPLMGAQAGGYVSWVKGVSGGFTIAHGAAIENAIGGGGSDTIIGNQLANDLSGRQGDDVMAGGAGDDLLDGGRGRDRLTGGDGSDAFVFRFASDSTPGSKRDVIVDFQDGLDRIDLRAMDADSTAVGSQDFAFIGAQGFHGEAGELRFAKGLLGADIDGDRRADFEVALPNVGALDPGDFCGLLAA